jgi:hypothetical protein
MSSSSVRPISPRPRPPIQPPPPPPKGIVTQRIQTLNNPSQSGTNSRPSSPASSQKTASPPPTPRTPSPVSPRIQQSIANLALGAGAGSHNFVPLIRPATGEVYRHAQNPAEENPTGNLIADFVTTPTTGRLRKESKSPGRSPTPPASPVREAQANIGAQINAGLSRQAAAVAARRPSPPLK